MKFGKQTQLLGIHLHTSIPSLTEVHQCLGYFCPLWSKTTEQSPTRNFFSLTFSNITSQKRTSSHKRNKTDTIIKRPARQPIVSIIIGLISPARRGYHRGLNSQHGKRVVVLWAYKKPGGGRALFARTCSPIIPISPHFRGLRQTLRSSMVSCVRGGRDGE